MSGNPINIGWGNKYQRESDYLEKGLEITRHYNSRLQLITLYGGGTIAQPWGSNWRSNFDRQIITNNSSKTSVYRPDGKLFDYKYNSSWQPADADVTSRLTRFSDGTGRWQYVDADNNDVELYDTNGKLLSITARNGYQQNLTYSTTNSGYILDSNGNPTTTPLPSGLLVNVTDSFNRQLNFGYDTNGQVIKMTDPNGGIYIYGYDANNNLTSVRYPDGTIRTYVYNEPINTSNTDYHYPHVLTGIVDENGARFATYKYDAAGRAISSEHAGEAGKVSVVYQADASGRIISSEVTSKIDATQNLNNTYTFQIVLGVVKNTGTSQPCATCGGTAANALTYDPNGNIDSRTDFNNNKTTYIYDLTRNLETSRTEALTSAGATTPQTRTITTTWHPTYRLPWTITEPGKTTTFTYDANGNQLTKTITDTVLNKSRTWTRTYNTLGQVLTVDGPRTDVADVTTYTYYTSVSGTPGSVHSVGDLETVTNALGHVTSITNYDLNGRPLSITDPNGVVTTMTYWPRGWLKTRTVNGVQTTTYDYDGVGQLTKVTLPDGSFLSYTYDAAHRLTDITDNAGNTVHYTLDAMGNRTREDTKDPANAIMKTRSRVFNNLNRLFQDIGGTTPATQIMEYGYDSNGNLKTVTDPLSRITTNDYDPLNRLITITDPAIPVAGVTENDYDAHDQLIQVKDPRLVTTDYTVDALGNVSVTQSPDSGTTNNFFDAAGNLIQKTDARGIVSNYVYDALNRLTDIVYPASPAENVTFVYDYDGFDGYSKGHLSYIGDAGGFVIVGAHDEYGNIIAKADWLSTVSSSVEYAYDSTNRVTGMLYPSGRRVTYQRNSLGQVTEVQLQDNATAPLQTLVSNVSYKPFGPISNLSFGNGVNTTLAYDADYRVSRITATSTPSWDYVYHYDAVGNIDQLTDQVSSNDREYAYDNLNRILQDKKVLFGTAGLVEYQYDAGGNRTLWKQLTGYAQQYASSSNRQTQYGATLLGHDSAGNLTSYGAKSFSYDSANRMSQSVVGSTTTTYRYNGLGQRTTKLATTGATTVITHYTYGSDGKYLGQTQVNTDGTFAQGDEYIWLDDMPIAQIHTVYGLNNAIASQQLTYIHADHLNTPRAMTDSTKKIVWKWESEAYGRTAPVTDPDGGSVQNRLDLRFPGQIADAETGLYYNNARYYDPITGRYTQSDPVGLKGGLNTFAYANGSPTSVTDPTGETAVAVAAPIVIGVTVGAAFCAIVPSNPSCVAARNLIKQCFTSDREDEDVDNNCEALYQSTLRTCASLSGMKKFKCHEAARINRDQCYQERGR
jgi:RHS repeat-associated protein